jgi:ABC-2 type transport system ATP-binding protein
MPNAALAVTDLHYCYGEHEAVSASTFNVEEGEVFGLLGPNGAGKTTTLSILAGIKTQHKGEVLVFGLDPKTRASEVKGLIGVVPQSVAIYPTITARDNLQFFCGIYGIKGTLAAERITEVLEVVQLSDRADEVVETYSGGMKRRLNIAVALLHRPKVLLMDEPTVGVDPQSRNHIFDCIERLSQTGTCVVYSTHYMEEAQRLCSRVAIMDHGKIIAMDKPATLCQTLGVGFFSVAVIEGDKEQLIKALGILPCVKEVKLKESLIEVEAIVLQNALAQFIEVSNKLGVRISSLQIFEPTLETVFLKMTGKQLRDE